MKVGELKKVLEELTKSYLGAEDWEVVMSKDGEGNSFSPLYEFSTVEYTPENSWSGEIDEPLEEDDFNAICLWPTN